MGESNNDTETDIRWIKHEIDKQTELLADLRTICEATVVRVAILEVKLFIWNGVASVIISTVISILMMYLSTKMK